MNRLLQSAKFWTAIVDVVVSAVLFFVGKYASPSVFEDIQFVIVTIQPVFIIVIGAWAYEDGKEKGAPVIHMSTEAKADGE